jgi:translation initiation factor 2 alpha subunit (eIF-2alpha)
VVAEFGQFPVLTEYDELRAMLDTIL